MTPASPHVYVRDHEQRAAARAWLRLAQLEGSL